MNRRKKAFGVSYSSQGRLCLTDLRIERLGMIPVSELQGSSVQKGLEGSVLEVIMNLKLMIMSDMKVGVGIVEPYDIGSRLVCNTLRSLQQYGFDVWRICRALKTAFRHL